MDEIDGVLARLATVGAPRSLGDDPAFLARLDASATRGAMVGMAGSAVLGIVAAVLMVGMHLEMKGARGPDPGSGALLTTASGVVL